MKSIVFLSLFVSNSLEVKSCFFSAPFIDISQFDENKKLMFISRKFMMTVTITTCFKCLFPSNAVDKDCQQFQLVSTYRLKIIDQRILYTYFKISQITINLIALKNKEHLLAIKHSFHSID